MKMKMFLMACLAIYGIQVARAQIAIATLHHKDSVSIFSNDQLQAAINKAVDGDIIYLSEGIFPAFEVGKNITIMGTGKSTVIPGTVNVKKSSSLQICNMHMTGNLHFINNGAVSGTRIMQCVIGDMDFGVSYSENYSTIELIMSQITGTLTLKSKVTGFTATNSKINKINGYGANKTAAKFINCNLLSIINQGTDLQNSYQNCIIGTISNGLYVNCLYKDGSRGTFTSCKQDADFTFDDDLNCSLTDAQLKDKKYLGTDGTVVGVTGGSMPFTLSSPLLQVVEHILEVDGNKKKLMVTLKLGNK